MANLLPIASRGNERSHGDEAADDGDGDLEVAAARAQSPGKRKKGWQSERNEGFHVPSIIDVRTERGNNCQCGQTVRMGEGVQTSENFRGGRHLRMFPRELLSVREYGVNF